MSPFWVLMGIWHRTQRFRNLCSWKNDLYGENLNFLRKKFLDNLTHYILEYMYRDSPTVWPLCALFFISLQFYVPFYVKKKKIDNFMCLLEFECAKRLKAHSRAIPACSNMIHWCIVCAMCILSVIARLSKVFFFFSYCPSFIMIIMIMSVFYSTNFNSDKSLCSKALMISDRHQTEAGKIHTI